MFAFCSPTALQFCADVKELVKRPVEAIKFRLEQPGKDFRALIGVIGQRTRVYEVMRRDRLLSYSF
jgi:antitoxin component HigA of HigAB toxin-antitoxin module